MSYLGEELDNYLKENEFLWNLENMLSESIYQNVGKNKKNQEYVSQFSNILLDDDKTLREIEYFVKSFEKTPNDNHILNLDLSIFGDVEDKKTAHLIDIFFKCLLHSLLALLAQGLKLEIDEFLEKFEFEGNGYNLKDLEFEMKISPTKNKTHIKSQLGRILN